MRSLIEKARVGLTLSAIAVLFIGAGCGLHRTNDLSEELAEKKREEPPPVVESETDKVTKLIRTDDLDGLKARIESGLDVNFRLAKGNTLLHEAVEWLKERIAKYLIEKGADTKLKNDANLTPKEMAVGDMKKLFLDPVSPEQIAELFQYARSGDYAKLKRLLDGGLSPNLLDPQGDSLMIAGVRAKQEKTVRFLVRYKGVDLSIRDADGLTALGLARKLKLDRLADVLAKANAPE